MKIVNLTENSKLYTSNVFLVLGTWNAISDVNTLIDVGSDDSIIEKIEHTNTGLGKKKLDQVVLTHSHSDHSAILPKICAAFKPRTYAFNSHLKGIDNKLCDGDLLQIGENLFEVFQITSHSHDSICLYNEDDGVLFSGDTSFPISFENDVLFKENEFVLSRLINKKISIIYPGHGPPQTFNGKKFQLIKNTETPQPVCKLKT